MQAVQGDEANTAPNEYTHRCARSVTAWRTHKGLSPQGFGSLRVQFNLSQARTHWTASSLLFLRQSRSWMKSPLLSGAACSFSRARPALSVCLAFPRARVALLSEQASGF